MVNSVRLLGMDIFSLVWFRDIQMYRFERVLSSYAPNSSDGKCMKNNKEGGEGRREGKKGRGEEKTFLGCTEQEPVVQQQT